MHKATRATKAQNMSSAPGSMAGASAFRYFNGQNILPEQSLSNCANVSGNYDMDLLIAQSHHDSLIGSWRLDPRSVPQYATQSMPVRGMFPEELPDQFHIETGHVGNAQDVHNYGLDEFDLTQNLLGNTHQEFEPSQIGGSGKARRPADLKEWENHKTILEQKYRKENYTLNETRAFMHYEHGFSASINAYKDQFKFWGWRKNIPQQDRIKAVKFAMKRKREQNKQTEFRIGDETYTVDQLSRKCKSKVKLKKRDRNDTDSDCELPSYMKAYDPETGSRSPSALSNVVAGPSALQVAQDESMSPTRDLEIFDNSIVHGTPYWQVSPSSSSQTETIQEIRIDPAAVYQKGRTGSQSFLQYLDGNVEESENTPRSSYSLDEDEERRESKRAQLNHLREISKSFDQLNNHRADNIVPDHVFGVPSRALLNEIDVGLYLDNLDSFSAAYAAIGRFALYTHAEEAADLFSSLMDFGEGLLFDSTHDLVLVLILTGRLLEISIGWTLAGGFFGKALSVLRNKYRQSRNQAVKFVEAICFRKSSQERGKDTLIQTVSSCALLNSMQELVEGNLSVQRIDIFLSLLTSGGLQDSRGIFSRPAHQFTTCKEST